MAQIARKLPSEAKPSMVNCDLGHSLFMAEGRIKFFCCCGKKIGLCRTRSVREIRTFGPQYKKVIFFFNIINLYYLVNFNFFVLPGVKLFMEYSAHVLSFNLVYCIRITKLKNN